MIWFVPESATATNIPFPKATDVHVPDVGAPGTLVQAAPSAEVITAVADGPTATKIPFPKATSTHCNAPFVVDGDQDIPPSLDTITLFADPVS